MKCPRCRGKTCVYLTRLKPDENRRRRLCLECGYRFATIELPTIERPKV